MLADQLSSRHVELEVSPSPPRAKRGRPPKAARTKVPEEDIEMEVDDAASYE